MATNVHLNSRIEGSGPAILLMHGLFGSHRNWFTSQRLLARNWQAHALDLRNHGRSGWADEMSYTSMADDVIAYMDAQNLEQAAVLGHSMGGKVAMSMALRFAQRIRALVLVDIAPVRYPPSLRTFLEGMMAVNIHQLGSRSDADAALAAAVPDPGIRGFLLQNLVKDDGGYRWRINLRAIEKNLDLLGDEPAAVRHATGTFVNPVQAIYGEESEYMRAEHREALQRVFPTASLSGIPEAGHWVHAEQTKAFHDSLFSFLNRL